MEKSKIDRINALAKKAKAIGLTERETAERDALRKEYLADMRAAFKQQLDSTYVQTADGAKIPYAEYAKCAGLGHVHCRCPADCDCLHQPEALGLLR